MFQGYLKVLLACALICAPSVSQACRIFFKPTKWQQGISYEAVVEGTKTEIFQEFPDLFEGEAGSSRINVGVYTDPKTYVFQDGTREVVTEVQSWIDRVGKYYFGYKKIGFRGDYSFQRLAASVQLQDVSMGIYFPLKLTMASWMAKRATRKVLLDHEAYFQREAWSKLFDLATELGIPTATRNETQRKLWHQLKAGTLGRFTVGPSLYSPQAGLYQLAAVFFNHVKANQPNSFKTPARRNAARNRMSEMQAGIVSIMNESFRESNRAMADLGFFPVNFEITLSHKQGIADIRIDYRKSRPRPPTVQISSAEGTRYVISGAGNVRRI